MGRSKCAACALVGAIAVLNQARAQDVAEFYKGKTITVLVSNDPGGGFDTYARQIARYLPAHIPGNPAVVVQNMPGAGGTVGTNWIYAIGPRDGTVLGAVHPAALVEPILGDKNKVRYNPARFNYIGSANSDVFVCVVRADAPAKTFADAFSKEVIVGAAGDAAALRDMPTLLNSVLGTKFKIIMGYNGSHAIQLAVEKGELQGQCGVAWSGVLAVHPDWFSSGLVKPFVQEEVNGYPTLNQMGVPKSVDFAKTPEQRAILELAYGYEVIGRPYLMAPEAPAERVTAMRKAFLDTLSDPVFLADASKMRLDIQLVSGEDVQKHIAKLFATPAEIVEKTRKAIRPDG